MADSPAIRRITTVSELDELLAESSKGPVWLFKHSLICPTSDRAWRQFQSFVGRRVDPGRVAVIEIQTSRGVSREAAERTGTRHQSPQVLLLEGGQTVWHASHWDITSDALEEAARACDRAAGMASNG